MAHGRGYAGDGGERRAARRRRWQQQQEEQELEPERDGRARRRHVYSEHDTRSAFRLDPLRAQTRGGMGGQVGLHMITFWL